MSGLVHRLLTLALAVFLVPVALGAHAETAQTASVGTGVQWAVPGGDPEATRYSRLIEIKPSTVATLTEEFSFQTGSTGNHEGQPLVVGSVMYTSELSGTDITNLSNYLNVAGTAAEPIFLEWWVANPTR